MKMILPLVALLYLVSWLLPVHDDGCTLGEGCIPGLEAFALALGAARGGSDPWYWHVLAVASALTNVWFLMSLAILLRWPHRLNRTVVRGLVFCWLVNLNWIAYGIDDGFLDDLLAGYYLWTASFSFLAVVAWKTLRLRNEPAV